MKKGAWRGVQQWVCPGDNYGDDDYDDDDYDDDDCDDDELLWDEDDFWQAAMPADLSNGIFFEAMDWLVFISRTPIVINNFNGFGEIIAMFNSFWGHHNHWMFFGSLTINIWVLRPLVSVALNGQVRDHRSNDEIVSMDRSGLLPDHS